MLVLRNIGSSIFIECHYLLGVVTPSTRLVLEASKETWWRRKDSHTCTFVCTIEAQVSLQPLAYLLFTSSIRGYKRT